MVCRIIEIPGGVVGLRNWASVLKYNPRKMNLSGIFGKILLTSSWPSKLRRREVGKIMITIIDYDYDGRVRKEADAEKRRVN